MHSDQDLARIGAAGASLIASGEIMVNRRVESVAFPASMSAAVRRRVSIDFNIPGADHLGPLIGDGDSAVYYLPLSVLVKWPPVDQLDIRDDLDRPIPLLTRRQNAVADTALLTQFARNVLRKHEHEAELDPYLERQLARIARERVAIAEAVWNELFAYPPASEASTYDVQRAILREDDYFLQTAGGIAEYTILWLRTVGPALSRHIVKFSYNASFSLSEMRGLKPATLGWQPYNVELDVPHIGMSGSYHLLFTAPANVRVTDARMRLQPIDEDPPPAVGSWSDFGSRLLGLDRLAAWWDGRGEPPADVAHDEEASHSSPLQARAESGGPMAHFYVAGERPRTHGAAEMSMMVTKRGFIRASAVASLLILALLAVYSLNLDEAVSLGAGSLTMLLLVPGLLGYLVVRPGEHPLATTFLGSLRLLVLFSGLLPVIGAGALVVYGNHTETAAPLTLPPLLPAAQAPAPPLPQWLEFVFYALTAAGAVTSAALLLAVVWPRKSMRRPFSAASSADAGMLVLDPAGSGSEAQFLSLADDIAHAEDRADHAALGEMLQRVETAELADDERAQLLDRLTHGRGSQEAFALVIDSADEHDASGESQSHDDV